jgi:hypothetical protein
MQIARHLYDENGIGGLKASVLEANGVDFGRLRRVGFNSHATLLQALGVAEEYARWRDSARSYRGRVQPKWTWERAIEVAGELVAKDGDLPTVEECRMNKRNQLYNAVVRSGHTWEDLRIATGLPPTVMRNGRPRYFSSRNGIRCRSRPEACLSNFLYARGVEHRVGERYPESYETQSGRAHGRYDLHFTDKSGRQIDVEVWGDIPDAMSHGRYGVTRNKKEIFQGARRDFLGIPYKDCLIEAKLANRLEPFIGTIDAFKFDKPQDRLVQSAHWSEYDEFLDSCRQIAAEMPDGVFPGDEWLRKRGRYADRPGPTYNTVAQRVNAWMGGTRRVRELLGQAEASTTKWTPESVVEAWQRFEATHNLTPSQCKGASLKPVADPAVIAEGARIYEVARRLSVVDQARGGRTGRKVKWTAERIEEEWITFCAETGRTPTECMSKSQREKLPPIVTDRASRIYQAATRNGLLEKLRAYQGSALPR